MNQQFISVTDCLSNLLLLQQYLVKTTKLCCSKVCRQGWDSNPRSQREMDQQSIALTTRPPCHLLFQLSQCFLNFLNLLNIINFTLNCVTARSSCQKGSLQIKRVLYFQCTYMQYVVAYSYSLNAQLKGVLRYFMIFAGQSVISVYPYHNISIKQVIKEYQFYDGNKEVCLLPVLQWG